MSKYNTLRALVLLWAVWAVIMIAFPMVAGWRYLPNRPDHALSWTANETGRNSQKGKDYLLEPFMNQQVSWDSEYYLSIAVAGYDDPISGHAQVSNTKAYSKNYAFFPFYPLTIRILSIPLSVLGMNAIATAALAGVIVSLLGTLAAVLALYQLVREEMGEDGAYRTVFYLLIFPTAFFFSTVYTEGLFVGLVLWCLVALQKKNFIVAAVLAALATWTRATGLFLIIPLAFAWLESVGWRNILSFTSWKRQSVIAFVCILSPVLAHLVWRAALGEPFTLIEDAYFGRSLTNLDRTFAGWSTAINALLSGEVIQSQIYFAMEFASIALALIASIVLLRKYPGIALFCLAALATGALTGAPQSLFRYVLTLPVVFIFLGSLGRNRLFDRAWTIVSILLLGMQVFLFSQDMWVA